MPHGHLKYKCQGRQRRNSAACFTDCQSIRASTRHPVHKLYFALLRRKVQRCSAEVRLSLQAGSLHATWPLQPHAPGQQEKEEYSGFSSCQRVRHFAQHPVYELYIALHCCKVQRRPAKIRLPLQAGALHTTRPLGSQAIRPHRSETAPVASGLVIGCIS
jgi:hypothetical protein